MHLIIYLPVRKKEKLNQNSGTSSLSEVINIDFWQIFHIHVKGTGQVGLEISAILTQTVSNPLHMYTNIGKAEIFHV